RVFVNLGEKQPAVFCDLDDVVVAVTVVQVAFVVDERAGATRVTTAAITRGVGVRQAGCSSEGDLGGTGSEGALEDCAPQYPIVIVQDQGARHDVVGAVPVLGAGPCSGRHRVDAVLGQIGLIAD